MTSAISALAASDSVALRQALPHLAAALDADRMRAELQAALGADAGITVEECGRPKAEITDSGCSIQYTLRTRSDDGVAGSALVLGTMFARPEAAMRFELERLRPLAAQASRAAAGATVKQTAVLPKLGLALSVFPVSAAHPTLVRAVDREQVAAELRRLLPGEVPAIRSVETVTVRRSRGCVLRYRSGPETQSIYGKVGYPAATADVQRALQELAGADAAGRGSVVFPRGLGRSAELDETFVTELPGRPPDLEQETERVRVVDVAAAVAARLHAAPVRAGAPHTLADELQRASRGVRLLGRFEPALAERLNAVLTAVRQLDTRIPQGARVFCHGSFAPSQLMFDGADTGLLDFERVCQAEAAFDAGRFAASLRVSLAGHDDAAGDDPTHRFLSRYVDSGGSPAAVQRAPLYELAALVRTCAHSWLQLKPSRLQYALSLLDSRAGALGVSA